MREVGRACSAARVCRRRDARPALTTGGGLARKRKRARGGRSFGLQLHARLQRRQEPRTLAPESTTDDALAALSGASGAAGTGASASAVPAALTAAAACAAATPATGGAGAAVTAAVAAAAAAPDAATVAAAPAAFVDAHAAMAAAAAAGAVAAAAPAPPAAAVDEAVRHIIFRLASLADLCHRWRPGVTRRGHQGAKGACRGGREVERVALRSRRCLGRALGSGSQG